VITPPIATWVERIHVAILVNIMLEVQPKDLLLNATLRRVLGYLKVGKLMSRMLMWVMY